MELEKENILLAVGIVFITGIISITVLAFSKVVLQLKHQHRQLSTSGVPYPPVEFFSGHAREIIKEGSIAKHRKWISTYNTMCRVYYGASHHILLTDLDVLKDTLYKHFKSSDYKVMSNMSDNLTPLECPGTSMACYCILNVNWTFLQVEQRDNVPLTNGVISCNNVSTVIIEQMASRYNEICNQLLEEVTDKVRLKLTANVSKIFSQYALQTSMTLFFEKNVKILEGERDELSHFFLKLTNRIKHDDSITLLSILTSHFPAFKLLLKYTVEKKEEWKNFKRAYSIIKRIVKVRRFYHKVLKYEDILNLLLESTFDKDISEEELCQTVFGLFLTTYLFTSNMLTYSAYLLAMNSNKQNRLIRAINKFYVYNEERSLFEASKRIEYLDWVVQESYRLYTPNAWTTIECTKSVTFNNGEISKGCTVVLPIQAYHRSPHYWNEPDTFNPERFSSNDRHSSLPLSSISSPANSYNEIIKKQTLTGVKMALVVILTYLKFTKTSETTEHLKTDTDTVFGNIQVPIDSIYLNIETNDIS